jgi:hypothetical protein
MLQLTGFPGKIVFVLGARKHIFVCCTVHYFTYSNIIIDSWANRKNGDCQTGNCRLVRCSDICIEREREPHIHIALLQRCHCMRKHERSRQPPNFLLPIERGDLQQQKRLLLTSAFRDRDRRRKEDAAAASERVLYRLIMD